MWWVVSFGCLFGAGSGGREDWVREGKGREGKGREWGGRLTVPGSLHVALDPFFYRCDVLLGVLEIFSDVGRLAAGDEAGFGRLALLGVDGPAAVLDPC